jgi:hypothetical protein
LGALRGRPTGKCCSDGASLTPEIIDQLDSIGWQRVRTTYPMVARRFIEAVDPAQIAAHRTSAKNREMSGNIAELIGKVRSLISELNALPHDIVEGVRWAAAASEEERYRGPPDRVLRVVISLEEMLIGLRSEKILMSDASLQKSEEGWRDKPSYLIAEALLDVFLVATGRRPGYGTLMDTTLPSGPFCKLLDRLFAELGLGIARPDAIARNIIKPLKENEKQLSVRIQRLEREQKQFLQRTKALGFSLFDPVSPPDFPNAE